MLNKKLSDKIDAAVKLMERAKEKLDAVDEVLDCAMDYSESRASNKAANARLSMEMCIANLDDAIYSANEAKNAEDN